ncbi:MAG: hypothetical protein QOF55_1874, partial [Thermoleophilaceae bacterium]|nr:hypothetical protein [Thermoleophilaceae bacterium]
RQLAESRSSTPEELKRLLENDGDAGASMQQMSPTLSVPTVDPQRISIGGPPNPNRRGI